MSLYPISLDGHPVYLLLGQTDWNEPVAVTYRLEADVDEALTGIEARAPRFEALRLSLELTLIIRADDVTKFRDGLLTLRAERIAVPLPMDILPVEDDRALHQSPFEVHLDERGGFSLEEGDAFPWKAPLLCGYFEETPDVQILSPGVVTVSLAIREDSPFADRIQLRDTNVPRDWPADFRPDWTANEAGLQVRRELLTVGDGRQAIVENPESLPRLIQQGRFLLPNRAQILCLLNFFHARRGRAETFLLPDWMIADAELSIRRYRFARDGLKLTFLAPGIASVSVSFVAAPDFEGESAAKPSTAYLFEFVYETPTPIIDRYTSYERNLVYRGQTFETVPIEHGKRKQSTNPAKDELRIISGDFRDSRGRRSPLWRRIGHGLERKLLLTIYSCDSSNVEATAKVFWRGSCGEVTPNGRKFEARCIPFAGRMESLVPSTILKSGCNNFFCDALCDPDGRLAAKLTVAHPVRSNVGSTVTLETAALPEGYFAGGWIEIGDGDHHEFRAILNNDSDDGKLRLHLQRPLRFDHPSETATLRPDCDGQPSRCKAYGNYARFRGFPFIPLDNPVLPDTTVNVDYSKK